MLETGESTFQVEFVIDLDDGRVAGRSVTSHPLATDLGESMAAAIRRAMDSGVKGIAASVTQAVESGKHTEAARALLDGMRREFMIVDQHSTILCDPARRIDVSTLDPNLRLEVLRLRCSLAGAAHQFDSALRDDIERLRGDFAAVVSHEEQANYELALALVSMREGRRETALAKFEAVAASPDATDATRAWAWRNLSLCYDVTDPRSSECAKISADLFLAAGNRKEAARSLRRYARCTLADAPERAIKALDDVLAWTVGDDVGAIAFRAGVLHVRADALLKLGDASASLAAAREAADLRKGLHGCLPEYAASLALAELAASAARDPGLDQLRREAEAARARCVDEESATQFRIAELVTHFDPVVAEQTRSQAAASGDWASEAWAHLAISVNASDGLARIENAERALCLFADHCARDPDVSLARFALAQALLDEGRKESALCQFLETLRHDPLNFGARQNYVALLAELNRWPEMIAFLEKELERHGEKPGLLTLYGRALLNAGDATHAVSAARRAQAVLAATGPMRADSQKLLDDALDAGGAVEVIHQLPTVRPLASDEFEVCLDNFRSVISGQQRMAFWQRSPGNEHKWSPSPEKRAQGLLDMCVSTKLGRQRVDVFQEVAAGAGRVDLFISGGPTFRCIVELKMLGGRYDTTYAFKGSEQIAHYMENRGVHLGYLVIIDGRKRDNGKGMNRTETVGASTVRVIFVDVRPTIWA